MKHFSALLRGSLSAVLLMLLWLAGPTARAQAPAWQSAMAMTSSSFSAVNATAADANGNIYMTGEFAGTIQFGTITLTSVNSDFDIFIAKWSSSTNSFLWAQRAGGTSTDNATAIAVQGTNVYIAGLFSSTTSTFGATTLNNTNPYSQRTFDMFVAKLTDTGASSSFIWAQQAGSFEDDQATSLAVSGTSVYVGGVFRGATMALGPQTLTNADGVNAGYDIFITKLTDAGPSAGFVWAKQAGGTSADIVSGIAVSGTAVYLTGEFASTPASFDALSISSVGNESTFVAKLTDAGPSAAFGWVQRAGGPGLVQAYAMAAQGPNVYITGQFSGATIDFGPFNLPAASNATTFVAKLVDAGPSGNFMWAQQSNGASKAIAVSGSNVYLTGSIYGTNNRFGTTTLSSAGNADVFVAKLVDAGTAATFSWAQSAGGTGQDNASAVALLGTAVYVAGNITSPANFGSLTLANPATPGRYVAFLAALTDPTLTATTAAQSSLSFSLAPNPARAAATLTLPALPGTATATLTLRDALGRTLRTETLPLPAAGLRHPLDLRGLAPGIYAVQVRAGSTAGTQRLVVE